MSEIDTKEYVYVMISTLNQMVNYIPLKHFEFDDIYNLTIQKSDYVNNSRWDENLFKILKEDGIDFESEDKILSFQQDEINDISNIVDVLEANFSGKDKIFWNITGGQRPFILAITKFIRDNDRTEDYICYLEGNKSKMVILQDDEIVNNDSYNLNNLEISTALKLMGFQFNSENIEIGKSNEREFYKKFYSEYVKNKKLREWLIILNKSYPKLKDKNESESYKESKKTFEEIKKSAKDKIKAILSDLDQELLTTKLDRSQAFGYILEELTFYKLEELLQDLIDEKKVTLVHSLKIKNEDINNVTVAEFDIALLTDNGKFIMFECKSGRMTGDTAKARNYATYAVSGVYGLPILITPILSTEKFKEIKDEILEDDYNDIYRNIKTAIASAERAGLDVWYLDNMDDKDNLKKYIEL